MNRLWEEHGKGLTGKTRAHGETYFVQMSTERIWENRSNESGSGEGQKGE